MLGILPKEGFRRDATYVVLSFLMLVNLEDLLRLGFLYLEPVVELSLGRIG
jgi:hypothetical protein